MTRKINILTAGFLGLASLFVAGNVQAEHQNYGNRGQGSDVRFGIQIGTGNGSIVLGNRGVRYEPPQPRVVIERVWVPAHYEEVTTRVLVHRGHFDERTTQVMVRQGHYVEKHTKVLVERGYFDERHTKVLVHQGHWDTQYVQPVFQIVTDRYGCRRTVMVRAGGYERVWNPDRYEDRCEKVWVPDRYEDRCEKVFIAPVYEMRCEKVWVPDRYEDRCEKVFVAGHYDEVRRVVNDCRDDRGRVNIDISHRGR